MLQLKTLKANVWRLVHMVFLIEVHYFDFFSENEDDFTNIISCILFKNKEPIDTFSILDIFGGPCQIC